MWELFSWVNMFARGLVWAFSGGAGGAEILCHMNINETLMHGFDTRTTWIKCKSIRGLHTCRALQQAALTSNHSSAIKESWASIMTPPHLSSHTSLPPLSYLTVPWWRRRGHRCDWDGRAQSLDHRQDTFRHVGGIVALVLPAAQLCRQNVSGLSSRQEHKWRYEKVTWSNERKHKDLHHYGNTMH